MVLLTQGKKWERYIEKKKFPHHMVLLTQIDTLANINGIDIVSTPHGSSYTNRPILLPRPSHLFPHHMVLLTLDLDDYGKFRRTMFPHHMVLLTLRIIKNR